MTVLKNGNVGNGPVNPSVKLEVGGQMKITGGSPGTGVNYGVKGESKSTEGINYAEVGAVLV